MSALNHMLLTIGFCTLAWWAIGIAKKWNSYSKMWEFNKRTTIAKSKCYKCHACIMHEHKESDHV